MLILYSVEDIGDDYGPSLNAAFADLFSFFGIRPRVKSPLGGKRTLAEALSVPGGAGARSDHYKGRGVDIDNQRTFRNINEAAFLYILAMHGWHNIQIDGDAFPEEPWHFACHQIVMAGLNPDPLLEPAEPEGPDDPEETDMLNLTALLKIKDGQNRLGGGKDRIFWFLVDPSGWVRIASDPDGTSELANYWSVRLGNVAAPNLVYADVELAVASAGHPVDGLFVPAVQFYRESDAA